MAPQLPPIFVLRHGETEWNREGRWQGHLDAPLTDLGREQAAMQGRILREQILPYHPTLQVLVSPLGRTRTTWQIASEAAGLTDCTPTIEQRLIEVNMGAWQGRVREEALAEDAHARSLPNLFEISLATPSGENYDTLSKRVNALLMTFRKPTLCVTHGITSLMLRGLVQGLTRAEMAGQGHDQGVVYHLKNGREERLQAKG